MPGSWLSALSGSGARVGRWSFDPVAAEEQHTTGDQIGQDRDTPGCVLVWGDGARQQREVKQRVNDDRIPLKA